MYSDTLKDVFKKHLSCSGSVSNVLLLRTSPLGSSPLLKRGQWAKWKLRTGSFVYILHATDSQNLAKIQQACNLRKLGITELAWEILQ